MSPPALRQKVVAIDSRERERARARARARGVISECDMLNARKHYTTTAACVASVFTYVDMLIQI